MMGVLWKGLVNGPVLAYRYLATKVGVGWGASFGYFIASLGKKRLLVHGFWK